jgi:hypothetical protein
LRLKGQISGGWSHNKPDNSCKGKGKKREGTVPRTRKPINSCVFLS